MQRRASLFLLVLATLLCLGIFGLEAQTRFIRRAVDDLVYDSRHHHLPCAKLPADAEVRSVLAKHQDVIQRIELVNPGLVGVEAGAYAVKCPGKADLLIWYASHQNRLEIEALLAETSAEGETFFGIPVRLQNR